MPVVSRSETVILPVVHRSRNTWNGGRGGGGLGEGHALTNFDPEWIFFK